MLGPHFQYILVVLDLDIQQKTDCIKFQSVDPENAEF